MTGGERMDSVLVKNRDSFHMHHVQMAVKIFDDVITNEDHVEAAGLVIIEFNHAVSRPAWRLT
jgi:hypothetical protein